MTLTADLKLEYLNLFSGMQVQAARVLEVNAIVNKINAGKARYQGIAQSTGVPWFFIGVIHYMEAGCNFKKHLHNGDPLSARTVQVPKGRPLGDPPFRFEQSAIDALTYMGYHKVKDWSIPGMLFLFEEYNGPGYRKYHPEIANPYLWSFSTYYTKGKYVADGKYDSSQVSKQAGAATILKVVMLRNNLLSAAAAGGSAVAIVAIVAAFFF